MKSNSIKTQRGLSLIELMIAVTLGIFISGGIIQLFVNSKQSYRVQENLSRLQENGRFAMEFITRDIRAAGYFGCLNNLVDIENELKDQTNNAWDITTSLSGYDNVSSTFSIFDGVVENTDVIVMRGLSDSSSPLISPFSNSSQMFVDSNFNDDCPPDKDDTCHIGEILMVTDCSQGTIFQSTNTSDIAGGSGVNVVHSSNNTSTPGNAPPSIFTKSYGVGSEIARLNTFGYYIRLNAANRPSLYRSRLVASLSATNALSAEELVEGIENMQILYGEDTDNDKTPNYYVPAGTAGLNMDNVVSVRVSLLATTLEDNIATQAVPYTIFSGVPIAPGDRKIRRVFTSTIAVRNRLP